MIEDRADSKSFRDLACELTAEGTPFRFRARGHSMSPSIRDGDVLHISPIEESDLRPGDIVLFHADFGIRAHRIVALDEEGGFMTRGDAGAENDPVVPRERIIGKVIAKEDSATGNIARLHGAVAGVRYRLARARRFISLFKTSFALVVLICLCSAAMRAQVAFDAATSTFANVITTNNPVSVNLTTGTGTNRLLVVGVSINRQSNTAVVVSGITYNGVALLPLGSQNDPMGLRRVEMWYQLNPASGLHAVVTTFANVNATPVGAVVGAITFTGVDQTIPFRTFTGANGAAGTNPSVTVASAPGDMVLDTVEATGNRTLTVGANQTVRWNATSGNNNNPGSRGFGSTEPGGNFVTMSETLSGTSSWAQGAVAIRPVGAADFGSGQLTGATPTLTFSSTSSGTNRLLVVGVSMNITNAATATVSGVTFNGVALTRAGVRNDAGNTRRVEMWYLVAPPAGTFNVLVSLNPLGAATIGVTAGAMNFTGIDQSQPVRTFASSAGTNAGLSTLDVLSNYGDIVIDTLAIGGVQTVTTFGPSQTPVWNLDSNPAPTAAIDVTGTGSTRAGAPSVPLSETFNANTNWAMGALALEPSNADVAVTNVATSAFNPANLIYTITVTNNGPSQASGVVATDTLVGGLTFVSATSTLGSCSGSPTITCNIGTLANGASATITVTVTPGAVGGYPNTVSVTTSGTPPDLNTGNNSAMSVAYSESNVCAVPLNPPAGGTLAGVINTYYPVTANVAAGATSIPVGTSRGSTTAIANGDLLLVIQMQDAAINTTNGPSYGDGGDGAGYTNLNNSGIYEFVKATGGVTGGVVPISGAGPGGGLLFSYTNAAATTTQGQRRFQVIRVPQFSTATLTSTVTAAAWNGTTGGVLALDVAETLTLNGATVSVDGLGFRGGAGLQLSGAAGSNQDFVHAAPAAYAGVLVAGTGAPKGEGIAGTPLWVESGGIFLNTGSAYPSGTATDGSSARGAPGNGGGGGTDANPGTNDQNAGGGGGGNGGFGGAGGDAWNTNLSSGGIGGSTVPASGNRLVMGGGGGGGTRNNDDNDDQASGGSTGGGIVLIRAGNLTGTATITANGTDAYNGTLNDAGGGGGAGGTILITSILGGMSGLTLAAHGGRGGDAWNTQAFSLADRHGPGGGGGGGVVLTSGAAGTPDVSGGSNGLTLNPGVSYGASPGTPGVTQTSAALLQTPGTQPAAACVPDLTIAKAHTGNFVRGATGTYRITVTNSALAGLTNGTVTVTDTLPTGLTPTAASGAGWSCTVAAPTVTCTRADALAGGTSYPIINITVSVSQTAPSSVTNTATVAGGGELNTTNDTATDVTTIVSSSDMSIVKTASVTTVRQNVNFTYTLTVTNNGPSNSTNVSVTDALPAAVTYVSSTTTQGSCSQAAGTVTCSIGSMNSGAVVTITITVTAGTPGVVTNTATVTRTEPDPVTPNNTSSVTITIVFPTQVSLETFTASTDAGGVLLSWSSSAEVHNLGFNLYREENGQRVPLNPSLVAGSALTLRSSLPQHSARTYAWRDATPVSGASYWLEDVALDGTRTLHGPIVPQGDSVMSAAMSPTTASSPATRSFAQAKTLAQLSSEAASTVASAFGSHRLQAIAASAKRGNSADETQYQLASRPAVKIAINHEGWYRVTQKQLISAGLNPWVDPRSLQLYADGVEQAIRVTGAGFGPGGFGPQAAIEFYGTGIDTPYSDEHVYWLVAGDRPGKRIGQWIGVNEGGPLAQDFPATVELKQRTTYFAALLRPDTDNFFGALVSPTAADQILTTPNVAPLSSDDAHLKVVLQGATDHTAHEVQVSVNGSSVGTVSFADQSEGQVDISVPNTLLRPDNNTVTLTSQNGQNDLSLVDFIQLTYPHSYTADSDFLKFTARAGDHVVVSGFTQPPARLLDITDPTLPILLQSKIRATNGGYSVEARVPASGNQRRTLLVLTEAQFGSPASLTANAPSSWHNYSGADYVIVSSPTFTGQLSTLADLHRREGHTVAVVAVDDVYDEFNFGEKDPAALKEFLQVASTNWRRKPASLLLVGDASFDPRNYLGLGDFDYVPTKIIPTAELKTSSDDWFSDFNNTGFAQINTGRLPVRTVDDAKTVVNKIVSYGSSSTMGSWTNQALLVADKDDEAGVFSEQAQTIQSLLPPTTAVTDVFVGTLSGPAARQAVLDGINSGKLLVNYNGHGSVEIWSGADLLDSATAATLTNGSRLPVFVIMNCLNGYFHDLYTQSLAEALLLSKNGGGVSIWASSGLTSADPQFQLDQRFTSVISSQPTPTLGDAIRAAKQAIADPDVRRTFLLFGDPLLRMRFSAGATSAQPSSSGRGRPASDLRVPVSSPRIR